MLSHGVNGITLMIHTHYTYLFNYYHHRADSTKSKCAAYIRKESFKSIMLYFFKKYRANNLFG